MNLISYLQGRPGQLNNFILIIGILIIVYLLFLTIIDNHE